MKRSAELIIPLKVLLNRLFISWGLLQLLRVIFLIYNWHWFSVLGFTGIVTQFVYAIRYDIAALLLANAVLIILHFIAFPLFYKKGYQRFLQVVFVISHLPVFILELIDTAYFPYNLKRTTVGALAVGAEGTGQLGMYIKSFWYLWILLIILLVLSTVWYGRSNKRLQAIQTPTFNALYYFAQCCFLALFVVLAKLIWVTSDQQLLSVKDAARYGESRFIPLHTSTTFVFAASCLEAPLQEQHYFDASVAEQVYPIKHSGTAYGAALDTTKLNVVLIIWESLSKEYVGYFNPGKPYTPFFDSLCREGMICTNAYANAKHSNEGICAVLASLPTWMEDCFYNSAYQADSITGLGTYLQQMGYTTSFYHGGNNGTMKFDAFSKRCGMTNYFGRSEYPEKDRDYDGNWGIWDRPFLQYMAGQLNQTPQPFFSTVFTLSSHHPYAIPPGYEGKLPDASLPIETTVAYTDLALRDFFHSISKAAWAQHTLFIITADHSSISEAPQYGTRLGAFQIPILYYYPGKKCLPATFNSVTQQIDILPTVLQACGYKGKFMSFGKSVLDTNIHHRNAITFINQTFQLITDSCCIEWNNGLARSLYYYKTDPLCKNNRLDQGGIIQPLMLTLKAAEQVYANAMLKNQLSP